MTSNHTNDRNARRHSHIAAKSHWIYTTQEVLGLYGVASNTLTAWKKLGASVIQKRHRSLPWSGSQ